MTYLGELLTLKRREAWHFYPIVCLSVCPSVTLVTHAKTVQYIEIHFTHYITLHQKTIHSGLSKSNFKDHYGDVRGAFKKFVDRHS